MRVHLDDPEPVWFWRAHGSFHSGLISANLKSRSGFSAFAIHWFRIVIFVLTASLKNINPFSLIDKVWENVLPGKPKNRIVSIVPLLLHRPLDCKCYDSLLTHFDKLTRSLYLNSLSRILLNFVLTNGCLSEMLRQVWSGAWTGMEYGLHGCPPPHGRE